MAKKYAQKTWMKLSKKLFLFKILDEIAKLWKKNKI